MDLGLEGKRAFVGGASRGIGLAIARGLLGEGADVAIAARGGESLEQARAALAAEFEGRVVISTQADLRDEAQVGEAVSQAVEELGGLDVAVASAGSGRGPGRWDPSADEWSEMWRENFLSAVLLSQAAAESMDGAGALCMIGSIAGIEHGGAPLPYNVAKAGLLRYTRDLARKLAPTGIRVNLVAPGNVLFPGGRWEELLAERADEIERQIESEVPMARFGTPEEIAAAVVFLCSAQASFITGACLVADGGQLRG